METSLGYIVDLVSKQINKTKKPHSCGGGNPSTPA
jgi:hypothetical protein